MSKVIQFPQNNKDLLIKELMLLQTKTINKILILSDRYCFDRDDIVNVFIT